MVTDTAAKKIYSAENICGLALEPCFKGSDFLMELARWPDEGTIDYPSRLQSLVEVLHILYRILAF